MKRVLLFAFGCTLSAIGTAQVTGTQTVPGSYPTLSAAVAAINAMGIGSGGATINVAAGYTETLSAALVIAPAVNGPNIGNPLVIQKSGVGTNPLITAHTGTGTLDGMIILSGADYVTIDGIDLQENAANTTAAMQMEWGYALLKTGTTNGAQNNTIKNCTITLTTANTGSYGIYGGNHTPASATALVISNFAGTNSYNKFYNNTITMAYNGISLTGYGSAAPFDFYDQQNIIGKDGVSTRRNQIINFGGGAASTNGIIATNQNKISISKTYINGGAGTTTGTFGIQLLNGTNSSVDIYEDTVTISSSSTTGAVYGIQNGMGGTGAGSVINIYNNVVTNCVANALTSGEFRAIGSTTTASYINIYGNTISNNQATISGTGAFNGILANGNSATLMIAQNIYNNTLSNNICNGGGSGMMALINANGSTVVTNCYGNTITTNNHLASTGTTYGYYNFQVGITENIYNNTISNLTGGSAETAAIFAQSGTGNTNKNIYGNTISNIVGDAAGATVAGINTNYAFAANVYNNNVYSITNNTTTGVSPAAVGITVNGNNNVQVAIHNNYVAAVGAPAASNANAAYGINCIGTATTYFQVYYNTVYLSGSSTGANYGSAALMCSAVAPSFEIRNNILVNISTPAGTGLTRALARGAVALTNYNTASGNNCLYAGTPSASNLLYSDGTNNDQTIQAFKDRVSPREQASFSELPPFINAAGFNLHLQTGTPTQCEGGAWANTSYTTDFDAQTRSTTTPDVGADEFTGTMSDLASPNIQYTLLTNSSVSTTRTVTNFATISDPSGINTTAGTRPRLYYKKSTNLNTYNTNTNATDGWKYVEATNASSPFSFTIDYTLLFGGSVSAGDVIQYFVVAQDLNGTPRLGVNAGGFTTQPTSVALAAGNFPLNGTINQYTIINAALSGMINVGPSELITSLTNVGGIFQVINSSSLSGNLTINITGDLTAETGTFALNQWAEEGTGGYTVSIVPSAPVQRNIYGSSAGAALIRFDGADRVNVDGRFAGNGTYLMFRNTSNSAPTIDFLNDAQNNTIQYCIIESGNTTTSNLLGGALHIGTTTGANGNDNITISNCEIRDRSDIAGTPAIGINCAGTTTTTAHYNNNVTITNCNIHDWFLANSTTQYGIQVTAGNSGFTITGNSFYQTTPRINTVTAAATRCIIINHTSTLPISGGYTISGNFIGGGAPGATGGDMTYGVTGTNIAQSWGGISVITGQIPNVISGNTIRNVDFTTQVSSTATTHWFAINVGQGVHSVNGNTVGSATTAGNVKIQIQAGFVGNAFIAGILAAPVSGSVSIANNTIGSIVVSGTTTGTIIPQWIQVQGTPTSTSIVSDNIVGSTTAANSILNNGTSGAAVSFGIRCITSTGAGFTITNNTLQNIVDNSAMPSTADYAILMISTVGSAGQINMTGNTIRDFTSSASSTAPAFTVLGMSFQGFAGTNHIIANNTLGTIYCTSTSVAQSYVVGIQAQGSSFGATMSQNRIFDIRNANTGASPGLVGVYISAGLNWSFTNNMISITNGTNTNFVDMAGIVNFQAAGATMNAYYNSIFIGGSVAGGTGSSFGLLVNTAANVNIKNNILYNKRTGGTGSHVAIGNGSSSTAGWTMNASNYNALIVADTTKVGMWGTTAMNMSTWRTTSNGDVMSIWETSTTVSSGALFVNSNVGNLHINTSTYPEALGTPIAGLTIDYDGDPRSVATPTIGADELACSAIAFTLTASTNVTCPGGTTGSATVGGTGGNGLTYAWAPTGGTAASATGLAAGTYTCTITNICGNVGTVTVNITEPAAITVGQATTPASCNGGTDGTATATVSGGTPGYTYSWSSGGTAATETGLAMGTYTVTVTDANSCTTTQTFSVTEPTAITASTMQTNPTCVGSTNGDAMVMPSGGTPGYTYSWSSGGTGATETGLGAGTYSCTITDANGCTNVQTVTLVDPPAITSSTMSTAASCNGGTDGSAMVMASGGTGTLTYAWSSGGTNATETGLGAGTYTVTLTDANGCTHVDSVVVGEAAAITTSDSLIHPTTCGGTDGEIYITSVGGNGPYTYLWSNSATTEDITGLTAGSYTLTITDNSGCTATATATLNDPAPPAVTLSLPLDTACQTPPNTITLTGESPSGGVWSGPSVAGNIFDPTTAPLGYAVITYTYTDTTTNCVGTTMDSMWVDVCTDVPSLVSSQVFGIYPNPNSGQFIIELNTAEAADVYVYDAIGQVVVAEKLQPGMQNQIRLETSGAYLVTVVTNDGDRYSQRVIVTQ